MAQGYDFIIVGAGASGSVLASCLAAAPFAPRVLLLEAGGRNEGVAHMSGDERFQVAFTPGSPLNWFFKTTPQHQLSGQEIDYSRGKGLGGSTAINFCGWVVGPGADYDEWARRVGDESFAWSNAKKCLKKVERAHLEVPSGYGDVVKPRVEDHGTEGPVDVSYTNEWVDSVRDIFTAAQQAGMELNPDVNDGEPIGMGIGTVCIYDEKRVTASSAYLPDPHPSNLTVLTDAQAARVLVEGDAARAVETVDGRIFRAKNEVILSGGALSTPQLLLLSGIGPREEIERHGIKVAHELSQVGRNLKDHCFASVGITIDRTDDAAGAKQKPTPMGWFKTPNAMKSNEAQSLAKEEKKFMDHPSVPNWELATHTPPRGLDGLTLAPDEQHLGAFALIMSPQSQGTVTLRSCSPADAPLIDPRFLTNPLDKLVLIEAVRQTMNIFQQPVLKSKTRRLVSWPKDESDEAVWQHIATTLGSSWHMCGTVRMGQDREVACVDSNFRVFGLKGLRVVDLSVCPLIPNNHTQTTAYIVGEIAAEKLIAQYGEHTTTSRL